MRAKILSFVMVTLGLVLCTLEEGGAANRGANATSAWIAGHPGSMRTTPLLLPYVANVSYSGELLSNAEFYARYPRAAMTLPTLDNLGFGYRRRGKRWRRRSQAPPKPNPSLRPNPSPNPSPNPHPHPHPNLTLT